MGRNNPGSSMGEAVDLQSIGANLHVFGEIDHPAMRMFNPSLAYHMGKLMISLRSCNFAVERGGKWYLRDGSAYSRTDVFYGELNPDTMDLTNVVKLNLSDDSPIQLLTAGLEDVRLFSRPDGMHAIGFQSDRLTRSLHNRSASMAEYLINGTSLEYIRTLEKPHADVVEKNWMPADNATKAFDFTYSPTQVWKDGKLIGEKYTGEIHGGTQLLEQEDGTYLSLVHQKAAIRTLYGNVYDKYIYYTYLARHDKNGIITKLSKPFRFGTNENIEFASGMVEYEGKFLISLGIRDCKFAIASINKERLMGLFDA